MDCVNKTYLGPEGGSSMVDLYEELNSLGYETHLYDGEFKTLDTPADYGSYYKWLNIHLETATKKYDKVRAGDTIELTHCGIIIHRGETNERY